MNPPSDDLSPGAGAVYVYRRGETTWAFEAYIKASNTRANIRFGTTVALSGDGTLLAIGAPQERGTGVGVNPPSGEGPDETGAVYLYRHVSTGWGFEAYMKAPVPAYEFGMAIALSRDGNVLAGGYGTDVEGQVALYQRVGRFWVAEGVESAVNPGRDDVFGVSAALSADGTVLVAGADWEAGSGTGVNPPSDDAAPLAGAVYTFR